MQLLDLYCHMARWELGDVEAMTPEEEGDDRLGALGDETVELLRRYLQIDTTNPR